MDVYIFDQRALSGRNSAFGQVADRLEQNANAGGADDPIVWRLAGNAPLARALPALAGMIADRRRGPARLRIVGHGYLGRVDLGSEGLTRMTTALFAPLAGKVRGVELHCCNVVANVPQTIRVERGINTENEIPDPNSGHFLDRASADATFAGQLAASFLETSVLQQLRSHQGIALMRALAQEIRAPVTAAMRLQTLSIHQWEFEGPTVSTGVFSGQVIITVPAGDSLFPALRAGSYSFNLLEPAQRRDAESPFVQGVRVQRHS